MTHITTPLPEVHRHLSAAAARRLLGTWRRSGPVRTSSYADLAGAMRAAILSGTLAANTRLPSERELAVELGVSRTTTAAAYRKLRDRGFAVSRTGVGTITVLPRRSEQPVLPRTHGGDAPVAHPPAREGTRRLVGPGGVAVPDDAAVIDLSQAAPAAPAALHDAYRRALESLPAYLGGIGYEPRGIYALRSAIAERLTERGTRTDPDQILITSGAQHALTTIVAELTGRGDRVGVQSPTYAHAIETVRGSGARVVGVPVGTPGGAGGSPFDVDLLESTVRRTTPRLVYLVPDHHNPTGYSLTAQERAQVRSIARRHHTVVVADETLTDLTLDGPEPTPFAGDGSDTTNVITVGSASKTFWGGLRVGWVRADVETVRRLARRRETVDIATSVVEQLVVVELLAERESILATRRSRLRSQRDALVDGLRSAVPEWSVPRPAGGLSLWIALGAPVARDLSVAAAERGVLVNPGTALTPDGSHADYLRATFAPREDLLTEAVPRLAAAWRAVVDG
ncbi:GntR family transcriptional regulator [Paraoerskovia sediminicola]|uniref:GntR family transcriptional regulator n=1 Tax=Paraoerskovia sediminicola TaxID=1138587 RepID=A0ABN6XEM5_9CELL|nr:PLP-dependent aminotransferase family protein [Paraoerskovia sediminicola]BDZ43304.1 GntR family transcriptional regulator [Paraoerskovia sediminicola]